MQTWITDRWNRTVLSVKLFFVQDEQKTKRPPSSICYVLWRRQKSISKCYVEFIQTGQKSHQIGILPRMSFFPFRLFVTTSVHIS